MKNIQLTALTAKFCAKNGRKLQDRAKTEARRVREKDKLK